MRLLILFVFLSVITLTELQLRSQFSHTILQRPRGRFVTYKVSILLPTTSINYLLSTMLFIQETQYNNTNRGSQDVDSHMEKYPFYTFFCKKEICSQDKASLRVRGLGPNCYKIGETQVQDGGKSKGMLLVNELLDPSAASSCVQFCLLNCVLMWYRDSFLQGRQQMVYSS